MTRVEWTRLDGADVEAVVAMFLNRQRPNSTRVTPSRGDGGVDILDRRAGLDSSDVVYQVKRYTEPLSTAQKNEVERSLERLVSDPRWSALDVHEWHLVMQWDPTPEADAWLESVAARHGLRATWHGLAYVEQLAARYPDVVDYYLHGGRSQVEAAYATVAAAFALDRADASDLDVPPLAARVQVALGTLRRDPHYRYELRFGEGDLPEPQGRPGLMMTWVSGDSRTGRWTSVDVIARCAASESERPITISGRFTVEPGSAFADELQDFRRFGVPFSSPVGAFEGEMVAPGGLGGRLENASVRALAVEGDLGDDTELHVEILDPSGLVLAEVDLDRTERSQGTGGARLVLEESHRVFALEDRYDLESQTGSRTLSFGDAAGQPVLTVQKALTFVDVCRAPNVGRLSVRHTPANRGVIDTNFAFEWSEENRRDLTRQLTLVRWLATIQAHTSTVLRMPVLGAVTDNQIAEWRDAARLLNGLTVPATYPEGRALTIELDEDVAVGARLHVSLPFSVVVGDQVIDLGRKVLTLENPTLLSKAPFEDHYSYVFSTPDRQVTFSLSGDVEDSDEDADASVTG